MEVIESKGNDMKSVTCSMTLTKSLDGRGETVINLMKTEMGTGVDIMERTHK